MQETVNHQAPQLLTLRDLTGMLRRSRSSVYNDLNAGRLPKPIRVGASVRWIAADVNAWIAKLASERGAAV